MVEFLWISALEQTESAIFIIKMINLLIAIFDIETLDKNI